MSKKDSMIKATTKMGRQKNICDGVEIEDCATDKCPVWKQLHGTCSALIDFQTNKYNGHWELLDELRRIAADISEEEI